jgi:hypothetical protein
VERGDGLILATGDDDIDSNRTGIGFENHTGIRSGRGCLGVQSDGGAEEKRGGEKAEGTRVQEVPPGDWMLT